jgi:hypothetical protein
VWLETRFGLSTGFIKHLCLSLRITTTLPLSYALRRSLLLQHAQRLVSLHSPLLGSGFNGRCFSYSVFLSYQFLTSDNCNSKWVEVMSRTMVRRQYILVLSTRLGPKTSLFTVSCRFIGVGHSLSLWLEDGPVAYNYRCLSLGSESRGTGYFSLRGPGIPLEQSSPVLPPDTEFPFCRLPWLSGLRWRYWNLYPRWKTCNSHSYS